MSESGAAESATLADVCKTLREEGAEMRVAFAQLVKALHGSNTESENVSRVEVAAMKQVILAARRARMLKGGGDSLIALGRALDDYEEIMK